MNASKNRSKSRGPIAWPILLVLIGGVLLVSNFLLLGEFDVVDLWPLLLVVFGMQVLLRGDWVPDGDAQPFGITRGRVEAATLEVNSGEIDVFVGALPDDSQDRLIGGQFARQSRPTLEGDAKHAHLVMRRQKTPWLSFTDWNLGISTELPWRIAASSYLGQISLDLNHVITHRVDVFSGIGDVHITLPRKSFDPVMVRSTLGNIHIRVPDDRQVQIRVHAGRFADVRFNSSQFVETEPNLYVKQSSEASSLVVDVDVQTTFGNVYLM